MFSLSVNYSKLPKSLTRNRRAFSFVNNRIIKTDSLKPVIDQCLRLDSRALVCFDVDKTLIIPQDKLATDKHFMFARELIAKVRKQQSHDNQPQYDTNYFQSIIYRTNKNQVLDPESKDLVSYLNEEKIRTIAFTALSRGSFGVIPEVLEWRITDLKQLGYNFNVGFPENYCFQFKDAIPDAMPAFRQGVLFSSTIAKGRIAEVFLDRIRWKPSEILFVDDQEQHVLSITEKFKAMGIKSTAFHYTKAEAINNEIDQNLALLQVRFLLRNHSWLSDTEAKEKYYQ